MSQSVSKLLSYIVVTGGPSGPKSSCLGLGTIIENIFRLVTKQHFLKVTLNPYYYYHPLKYQLTRVSRFEEVIEQANRQTSDILLL